MLIEWVMWEYVDVIPVVVRDFSALIQKTSINLKFNLQKLFFQQNLLYKTDAYWII